MPDIKRVIVTGATGLIGKEVCKRLSERGYSVVVFSRNTEAARQAVPGAVEYVSWQPTETGPWTGAIDGAHAIISLGGAPVFGKRWSEEYKREIRTSRILGTRGLVNAMTQASTKPKVFVSGSAVGYYGYRDDSELDESAQPGNDFLASVCQAWEQEAAKAEALGIRTVIIRTGIVLDKNEGALPQMLMPFRLFTGGPILPGTQWFPWVHVADEVGIILLAVENENARGPINASAPEPQTNRDFSATLGKVVGTPSWLPVPGVGLKILLGDVAEMLTEGQRVIPKKALELGYHFHYPTSEQALRQILKS